MNRRHEDRESPDDFPTPQWATRALMEHVIIPRIYEPEHIASMTVWEPACNRGFMARPLAEYFDKVIQTDIHDYSDENPEQDCRHDFLWGYNWHTEAPYQVKNSLPHAIITNPPFRLAEQFIRRAFDIDSVKFCAFFVRLNFLEGIGRYNNLFKENPPAIAAPFTERVPLLKGRIDPHATTATAYCWLVWIKNHPDQAEIKWIPPCRKKLERPGDYE